ncbi:MAG: hypothetical protein E7408_02340 [Ruminococcaceae bacterium]|nr:hypothetical protein [Oscillospiraceae bacterium]
MISCTEFIPMYSEFFKFLEKKGGYDAVLDYWYYISDRNMGDKSNPNSLISFLERDGGFEGAIHYWDHTLTEEACDVLKIHDYNKRYSYNYFRHCPSRGMLNALKHIEPYHDYCEHCKVIYSRVLEKYGIVYERDHSKIDQAQCSSILYEKGNRPIEDFTKIDDTKVVVDMKAEDNKYLHRDFHLLGDLALRYCGETLGDAAVIEFLDAYAKVFYAPQIEDFRARGLVAVREWLEGIYAVEEAGEVLHTTLSDDTLWVTVDESPVIAYMHTLGQEPSKYYIEETRTLYASIANACNFSFTLEDYRANGACKYKFFKK